MKHDNAAITDSQADCSDRTLTSHKFAQGEEKKRSLFRGTRSDWLPQRR